MPSSIVFVRGGIYHHLAKAIGRQHKNNTSVIYLLHQPLNTNQLNSTVESSLLFFRYVVPHTSNFLTRAFWVYGGDGDGDGGSGKASHSPARKLVRRAYINYNLPGNSTIHALYQQLCKCTTYIILVQPSFSMTHASPGYTVRMASQRRMYSLMPRMVALLLRVESCRNITPKETEREREGENRGGGGGRGKKKTSINVPKIERKMEQKILHRDVRRATRTSSTNTTTTTTNN